MPIKLINMIPKSLSGETGCDGEPSIAVNPANPRQIAASAFTPDPASSGSAPIFVSTDGGNTWTLNVVLPGGNTTGDTSLRFANASGVLYAGILRADTFLQLNILRSANFTAAGLMGILQSRANVDQPWVEAATALGGAGVGADRLYVSNNDMSATPAGRTANIDQSLNAASAPAPAGLASARIESRATVGQDFPPVRTAMHHNGTVYGIFLRWWGAGPGGALIADVVVVRDDDWGAGATPYRDLVDAFDSQPGVRVIDSIGLPPFLPSLLGTQRTGYGVAIAVDPRNSRTVYVAWVAGVTGATCRIHLRRSTDGGQNWSADLRLIATAMNPCLAVNVHGKVGFMYQQLGNPGTGNRWRTHLEISADAFATAPTDFLLADVPDVNGTYNGNNAIGDYANLIAIGKDFYGVFSGNNTPNNANFPNGVTYQRNANFSSNTLLHTDNTTTVGVSIDPFMVHYTDVAVADDFYVRDWTDSPTSGDTGVEPSTHPVFYATSDVWNRRGTLPGSFPNDQPSSEPAGNGTGNIGDNWAFARIRRNAAGTGSKTVTAHFLVSKLGVGSNYVDAGTMDPTVTFPNPDPTVVFNAADLGPITTAAYPWHLAAVSSTHLCLAVEISAPGDPFVAPSLRGRAPGWPTTDLAVLNDNNKAQRNMGLSTTPARGIGLSNDAYAIVHNAATFERDMEIRCDASPEDEKRLSRARIAAVGGRESAFKAGMTLVLPAMQPGENRWIGLSFEPPRGKPGEVVAVFFTETAGSIAINGFGLGTRIGTDVEVVRAALSLHRSVFTRLAAQFDLRGALEQAARAEKLAGRSRPAPEAYVEWLRSQLEAIPPMVRAFVKSQQSKDVFGVGKALRLLSRTAGGRRWAAVAVAHTSLLNRLDSYVTALQLERGDPADILQNVRWQDELYGRTAALRKLECAERLSEVSRAFIDAFGERESGPEAYPTLIKQLLACFEQTAQALPRLRLEKPIAEMQRQLEDMTALQKAHREYLLALDRSAGRK